MAGLDRLNLRILIGAGSFTDAAAALRLLEGSPLPLFTGLGGLFIEEPDLFAACGIPRQRVVLPSGATTLAPTASQVRLLLRADARAFERAGSETAKTARAGWAFAREEGELVATSLRAAKGWDVLLMGYRRVHPKTGKVVVIKNTDTTSEKMDAMSEILSRRFRTDCLNFSVSSQAKTPNAPEPPASYRFETMDTCLRALARTNCLVVLVDLNDGPFRSAGDLSRILEAARCPVMVFGAQAGADALEHTTHFPDPDLNGAPENPT